MVISLNSYPEPHCILGDVGSLFSKQEGTEWVTCAEALWRFTTVLQNEKNNMEWEVKMNAERKFLKKKKRIKGTLFVINAFSYAMMKIILSHMRYTQVEQGAAVGG